MYNVRAIANWFLDHAEKKAGEQLTAMKLQKLAYVSHGWYMAYDNPPLVDQLVEAWKWGPVFRSLYVEFQHFGGEPISERATLLDGGSLTTREIRIEDYHGIDHESVGAFLSNVWNVYGGYSAGELSDITHRAGTPWHQMFEQMGNRILPYTIIPNKMIKDHYKNLLDERTTATA